jgi:hypothetical protein
MLSCSPAGEQKPEIRASLLPLGGHKSLLRMDLVHGDGLPQTEHHIISDYHLATLFIPRDAGSLDVRKSGDKGGSAAGFHGFDT